MESKACLEMPAKGIKNSSFPTCIQQTWCCSNSNRKRDGQLALEWCISHTQICCIWYNPFS